MEWFKRWFGKEYLTVYEHRNAGEAEREVQTIASVLDIKKNDLVLDLCCGNGRHDIPLVSKGCRVIGLDFSLPLILIACNSGIPGQKYPLYICADARQLPFCNGIFDIVINLFTSFGYYEDDENYQLLCSISQLLKPGGRFYIDYLNPQHVLAELVDESTKESDSIKITEKRKFDHITRRIEKEIILKKNNDSSIFHESVRLYELDEMTEMIENAGLSLRVVLGSVNGEPYSETSERMILYGTKKAGK